MLGGQAAGLFMLVVVGAVGLGLCFILFVGCCDTTLHGPRRRQSVESLPHYSTSDPENPEFNFECPPPYEERAPATPSARAQPGLIPLAVLSRPVSVPAQTHLSTRSFAFSTSMAISTLSPPSTPPGISHPSRTHPSPTQVAITHPSIARHPSRRHPPSFTPFNLAS
ncbi:hypothetical protein DACRYDRAFT_118865 [Dacryopinax primogenitus]|uniref:Uncharacterized protein n=1 Tax=Dacryopinax primogenitus (strain DJM 731) TaxID=1858805 RepID=M5FSE6_DACPD|nr:uncharacterized protein DACRYDRAFT_118865 [Dacryopinax primogenitus]EJT98104.1 hypothetical protein DACRYDRAFT_118865 [Dacryopinax primogenitus]